MPVIPWFTIFLAKGRAILDTGKFAQWLENRKPVMTSDREKPKHGSILVQRVMTLLQRNTELPRQLWQDGPLVRSYEQVRVQLHQPAPFTAR